MCIILSAVMIALRRAIRVVCLHDVSMIAIGVEGADQDEEEPSHHHVAPGMSLPHEPSHYLREHYWSHLYREGVRGTNNKMQLSELQSILGSGPSETKLLKYFEEKLEELKRK
jgi:hypothetical protein